MKVGGEDEETGRPIKRQDKRIAEKKQKHRFQSIFSWVFFGLEKVKETEREKKKVRDLLFIELS